MCDSGEEDTQVSALRENQLANTFKERPFVNCKILHVRLEFTFEVCKVSHKTKHAVPYAVTFIEKQN